MATFDEFAEVAVATARKQPKKKPTSQIVEVNALLNFIDEKGGIKTDEDGGTIIERAVVTEENQTLQNYVGAQLLNPGYSPIMTKIKMGWSQKAMFVVVTGREIRINMSDAKFFSFVEEKLDNARQTAANRMAVEIYGDGSLYESIVGIAGFCTTSGAGTYGGIDPTITPRWKNQIEILPGAYTGSDLEKAIDSAFIKATDGVDRPDVGIATIKQYTMLEAQVRDRTRNVVGPTQGYMNKSKAALGFPNLEYKYGLPIFYDINSQFLSTDDRTYLLCSKHIELYEHPDAKWEFDEGQRPINQDTMVMFAPWMGGMINRKRRNHCLIRT